MKKQNFRKVISGMTAMSILSSLCAVNVMAEQDLTAKVYADDNGVVLTFSESVKDADLNGIKLYKGAAEVSSAAATVEEDGDVLINTPIERDAVYTLSIPQGLVGESASMEKKFVVKEVLKEDFDKTADGQLPSTIIGSGGSDFNVQNKELQHKGGNFYLNYTGENYTVNFDMKAYQKIDTSKVTAENPYPGTTAPYFMRLLYNVSDTTNGFNKQPSYTISLINSSSKKLQLYRGGASYNAGSSSYGFSDGNCGDGYTKSDIEYTPAPAYGVISNSDIPVAVVTDEKAPQAQTIRMSTRKTANEMDLYIDNAHAINYTGGVRTADNKVITTGYFGIQEGAGTAAYIYDNFIITACYEPEQTEVTGIYADQDGVYLTFDKDVSGVNSEKGITLQGSDGDVDYSVSTNGKGMTIAAKLDVNTVYELDLGAEFGGGVVEIKDLYSEKFMVKQIELTADDFQGATVENNKVIIDEGNALTLLKGYDKEDYSISYKLSVKDSGNPNLRMWYNAAQTGNFHADTNKAYVTLLWKDTITLSPCANKKFRQAEETTFKGISGYTDGSTIKLKKNKRSSEIYLNGRSVAKFNPKSSYTIAGTDVDFNTTGYFGIWNVSNEANGYKGSWPVTLTDVKMTYFAKYDPKPMSVESVYADENGVVVDFNNSVANIGDEQIKNISISKNGEEIDITGIKAEGDKLTFDTKDSLALNTIYDVELAKGFGTEDFELTEKYMAQFKLKEVFAESFDDALLDGGITISNVTKDKVYDNELYLRDTLYVKGTNKYSSYTLNFDLKSYSAITGKNDSGEDTYSSAPMYFRPFFTAEDKFFTQSEGYVWQVDNEQSMITVSRGGSDQKDDGTWGGYNGTKYNVNGQKDVVYNNTLSCGKLSTNESGTTVPYSIKDETAKANKFTVRKNDSLAQLYIDNGYASSLNLSESFKNCFFGIQNGWGNMAYIVDNISLTVCESVTSTVRAVKLSVKDSDNNNLTSLSGISYAKGEVVLKNYTDSEKPVVAVVAAYDSNNKLLKAQIVKKENIKAKTQEILNYELKDISGVAEISAFCWDSFQTIVPYSNAITVK